MKKNQTFFAFFSIMSLMYATSTASEISPNIDPGHIIMLKAVDCEEVHCLEYIYAQQSETINQLILDINTHLDQPIPLPNITNQDLGRWLIPVLKALENNNKVKQFSKDVIRRMTLEDFTKFKNILCYFDIPSRDFEKNYNKRKFESISVDNSDNHSQQIDNLAQSLENLSFKKNKRKNSFEEKNNNNKRPAVKK